MPVGSGPPPEPVADSPDSPPIRDFAFTLGAALLDVHGDQQGNFQTPPGGAGYATPKPAHAPSPAPVLGYEAGIQDQQLPDRSP